ncbi:hypothetical protein J421_4547 [Gemmatirosa kalamazoonensis]|uniref:Uncharacterized protein n=1 Tax=Gemmatirosa kalamazoonensis TaxID=861299 RepID=W0RLX3_9BACT|nr:hypothetical protein [Gemmatirosa kalamazoonensis]AHG87550.1 hypothetical protein J421_0012 [Gemmatirosa kalamazoonensis]AHG92084.1 hypothetical protein J421_4547 [Gemmatirosa kalamazoonensis]
MSFLSPADLDALIYALLTRSQLAEDERRALILELVSRRRTGETGARPSHDLPKSAATLDSPNGPSRK